MLGKDLSLALPTALVNYLLNTNKEYKSSKKQEIQNTFIKTN